MPFACLYALRSSTVPVICPVRWDSLRKIRASWAKLSRLKNWSGPRSRTSDRSCTPSGQRRARHANMWAIEVACARVISLSRSIPVSCEGKRARLRPSGIRFPLWLNSRTTLVVARVLASIDRGTLRWSYPGGLPAKTSPDTSRREAAFGVRKRAPGERPSWDRIGSLILGACARYDGRGVPGRTVAD